MTAVYSQYSTASPSWLIKGIQQDMYTDTILIRLVKTVWNNTKTSNQKLVNKFYPQSHVDCSKNNAVDR